MEPEDSRITEKDFAHILLLYAGLNQTKRIKMMKRVKAAFKDNSKVMDKTASTLCISQYNKYQYAKGCV